MFGCKKYKREFEILALLILILVINSTFQINLNKNASEKTLLRKDNSDFLKSAYYNTGSIFIEDDNPAQDWAYHASNYPWCSGSGVENDPYIIDNVYIDAGGVGNCIRIIDSDVYFIIQNSLLNNSVNGIDLDDANNGIIQNNTISSHGQRGIEWEASDNITIQNNTFSNNYRGIHIFSFCENVIITNNIFSNSVDYNIYLSYIYDGRISHNTIDNGQIGITQYECTRNNITDNIIRNIVNEGIKLTGSNGNNVVSNNILNNTLYGIYHESSADNIFYNNTAFSSSYGMFIGGGGNQVLNNSIYSNTIGLIISGGSKYVSSNNISLNTNNGINIIGWDNNISNNDLKFNLNGIKIIGGRNNIEGNNVEANSNSGILMQNADNNTIDQNLIRQNQFYGIFLDGFTDGPCYYNVISKNIIAENSLDGIYSDDCHSNTYLENNISNHTTHHGIDFNDAENTIIRGNRFYDNLNGIRGISFYDNIIEKNNFTSNRENGVYLEARCQRNNFSENEFNNNFYTGINIDRDYNWWIPNSYTNGNNLIHNNSFIGNTLHAFSNSTYDFWNSSVIGNYWDDFLTGVDVNDDGISEIPYNVSLVPFTQDYLPIYDDGDDPEPPIISIVSPIDNQVIGNNSPNFQIHVSGLHVDTTWYQILGGSVNYTFSGNSDQINQGLWDEFGNGTVTLRFYVNDSLGYGTFDEKTVRKDINQPQIVINTPASNNLYDNIAPIFDVEISDPNLDTSWYSLDGGLTNYIFTTNYSINQTLWDTIPDGQVEIKFYVNDTAENLIFDSVTVRKDTHAPVITITSPNSYDLFGNSTINFNVEITDLNLEKMWYTIVGSLTNITFISNDTIDTTLWNSFGSGDLTLTFYANDTHGRVSINNVIVSKDIDPPSISIISPTSGETFYVTPPEFEITVSDTHLELVWYTIDGGITNITITQYTDFISQSVWDPAPQGDITLKFYARDSLGNIKFAEITIKKSSVTQQQPPQEIPGYDLYIMVSMIMIMSVLFVFKKKKKKNIFFLS